MTTRMDNPWPWSIIHSNVASQPIIQTARCCEKKSVCQNCLVFGLVIVDGHVVLAQPLVQLVWDECWRSLFDSPRCWRSRWFDNWWRDWRWGYSTKAKRKERRSVTPSVSSAIKHVRATGSLGVGASTGLSWMRLTMA
jgi:hypothetical protein